MKKFNLLFVCLAFAAGLQAQQKVQTIVLDSWTGTTWQPSSRITYSYDANCFLITFLLESWDAGTSTWANYLLSTYTNNPDGTPSQVLQQTWNNGTSTWTNQSRITYTYTSFGKQATALSEYWLNNKWKNASRVTNTYDAGNYLINQLSEISLGGSNWINGSQTLYTNNSDGSVNQAVTQGWNFVGPWKDQSRITYTYYNNDPAKILTSLNEIWDGSTWQNGSQTINTYNVNGIETTSLSQNWDGLVWVNSSLETSYYQVDGTTLESIISQNWDNDNSVWVNATRNTITYGPCTLPLTLLNFNAVKQNGKVQLSWKTANEINTQNFSIQRSTTASNFTTIGKVNAAGGSAVQNSYSFSDDIATLKANKIYYRLQQQDKDGKSTYSNIVAVSVSSGGVQYSILPNPARSYFTVITDGSADLTNATVSIINLSGKKVLTQKLGNDGQQQINISSLPKGLYMVNVVTNTGVQTQKLVVE